jgi:ATP-binding cassette subfamily F protein 3
MADVLDAYTHVLSRLESAGGDAPGEASEAVAEALLAGLGLPEGLWDQPVRQLSGGEDKMVGIAALLASEPDVLLLDEPDNHLDSRAKMWLEGYLADYRGAVGLITHDRYMIDRVANAILEIEDARIAEYPGNYSAYKEQKRKKLEREAQLQERQFRKLKASAEQLTQWARQNPKFASRAENQRRKMAEERQRLDDMPAPPLNRRRISVDFEVQRGGTVVLEAEDVGKAYGSKVVFEPFDLLVHHGERVGLVGPNGAGKTTLFRMIQGVEEPSSGRLRTGASLQIGYFSQENETLDSERSALDLIRLAKSLNEQQALSVLVEFLFDREDAMRPVSALSGGERSRLQLAILMLSGANVLLLDEPTNNLDLASVETLEDALMGFGGSFIAISHDRYFLDRICTRIIEVDAGIVRDFPGSFQYYRDHPDKDTVLTRALRDAPAPQATAAHGKKRHRSDGKARKAPA